MHERNSYLMLNTPIATVPIEVIDWQTATYLASGCCGVVFTVHPGIVAKVAPRILPHEASIQSTFAQEGLALPVLAYAQAQWLPPRIRQAACSLHGLRRSPFCSSCTCDLPVDVLLMPCAERICTDEEFADNDALTQLSERVGHVCWQTGQYLWDEHAGNIAVYQGRSVALDFGDVTAPPDALQSRKEQTV
jgi:hypothetical protein